MERAAQRRRRTECSSWEVSSWITQQHQGSAHALRLARQRQGEIKHGATLG
ncbi:hypothetical protein FIBSPDRAFT_1046921 [Athelia psychrophila]|uniref:Uncharacterized protein n=1 Tax=Athelia psychrophila TaxID=1759441 RepID=A0A166G2R5_9AGAM|nr:hypothetical protein FIBSPDRAFT_1046917 [Fibularhizoctonia sp. CBS 109695]KZP17416.1 hypothetical protein FIBSPDRAFT_1046921 [Fibularhizoctonia sp. CBS 109695]